MFAALLYCGGTILVKVVSDTSLSLVRQSMNPLEHLYIFILGICLAKLFEWIAADQGRVTVLQRWAPVFLLIALAAFVTPAILDRQFSVMLLQHGIQAPIFALVLLAFASGQRTIVAVFSTRWFVILGEASFALYLIHQPVTMLLRHFLDESSLVGFGAYLVVAIGLSIASIYWLEMPARRWILHRYHIRSVETAVTSSLAQ
jgi:peptidoglycan/LPS O-acetylase OafA/YrhL